MHLITSSHSDINNIILFMLIGYIIWIFWPFKDYFFWVSFKCPKYLNHASNHQLPFWYNLLWLVGIFENFAITRISNVQVFLYYKKWSEWIHRNQSYILNIMVNYFINNFQVQTLPQHLPLLFYHPVKYGLIHHQLRLILWKLNGPELKRPQAMK